MNQKTRIISITIILIVLAAAVYGIFWYRSIFQSDPEPFSWLRDEAQTISLDCGKTVTDPPVRTLDPAYTYPEINYHRFPDIDRTHRELIEEDYRGPLFAGHYDVVTDSCGTNCQMASIIDVKTGELVVYGLQASHGFDFKLDSHLLVVNPVDHIQEEIVPISEHLSTDYYLMEDSELRFVCKADYRPQEDQICATVIVPAVNPATGETRDFPTPCAVPKQNWQPHTVESP